MEQKITTEVALGIIIDDPRYRYVPIEQLWSMFFPSEEEPNTIKKVYHNDYEEVVDRDTMKQRVREKAFEFIVEKLNGGK